ncbi:MAG TPA: peptidoglycan-associated lipoprotein Pal [Solirubrobacteraceae bacterium]|jgi:peptidoglycan-associated lipoprotein|nr:peptidoglycan-associated lipoprotein Pal [Solirubrobacteraceae bacterium]
MLDARRLIACAAIVAAIFVGCAKRPALIGASAPAPTGAAATQTVTGAEVAASPAAPAAPAPVAAAPEPVRPSPKEFVAIDALKPIYFDFDKYDIRPGDRRILDANAQWLKEHANQLVLIEGHCDERGTNEYNLGLGDRRARATMNYLVGQGVQANRFTIVSYGEERPVCTEKNESCWQKNRRAAFLVKER